jgi:hypothetical protein
MKDCPDDKILNPATGRCVKKSGAIGKKLLTSNTKSAPAPNTDNKNDDKILNPATGRYVSKTGKIGKKILLMEKLGPPANAPTEDNLLSKEEKELLKKLPSYISPSYVYYIGSILDFMTNDTSYSLSSKIKELENILEDLENIDYEVSTDISTRNNKQQEKAKEFLKYNTNRTNKVKTLLDTLKKKMGKSMK